MSIALSQLGQLIEIEPEKTEKETEDGFQPSTELLLDGLGWYNKNKISLLTPEEERSLIRALGKDPTNLSIRNAITDRNLGLVAFWVKRIIKSYPNTHLEFLDLCQEGTIGLMHAVTHFQLEKGFKFSTYASWGIRQSIIRAIENNGSGIRLPVYTKCEVKKFLITKKELTETLGREPLDEEIAERMMIPLERISIIKEVIALRIISLDKPVKDGESENPLLNFIPDPRQNTEEAAESLLIREEIKQALETLSPREQKVIKSRFGWDDEKHLTLEKLSKEMKLTRQGVSLIEKKALKKLKRVLAEKGNYSLEDFAK